MIKYSSILIGLLLPFILQAQSPKSLQIGDTLPPLYFQQTSSGEKMRINAESNKAILIDFWATWCSPCVGALPKLDSIQKKYENKLDIVMISREEKGTVVKLLNEVNRKIGNGKLSSVVEDTIVSALFPHKVLPHYVWVDKNNVIVAITDGDAVSSSNVEAFLNNETLKMPLKTDFFKELDSERPTFTAIPNNRINDFIYQSAFLKYQQDVYTMSTRKSNFIRCTNHSILLLYKMALGEFNLSFVNNNRVILEGFKTEDDSLMIGRITALTQERWKKTRYNHLYNYEIHFNKAFITPQMSFELMRKDLNSYFGNLGISGVLENRKQKVLGLIRTSNTDKLKTSGGLVSEDHNMYSINLKNVPISSFITKLQSSYYTLDSPPIIDETKYLGNVDINIRAELKDINLVNKALERYDLRFVEMEREVPMIVIKKKN